MDQTLQIAMAELKGAMEVEKAALEKILKIISRYLEQKKGEDADG